MAKENRYTSSGSFKKAKKSAESILKDKSRLKKLLDKSTKKISDINSAKKEYKTFAGQLKTAVRMVRAFSAGQYKEVPWKTLISIVAGLLYFIMPLDFIPDFLPFAGMVDDLSVLLWVFNRFKTDVAAFGEWEQLKKSGSALNE